MGEFGRMLGDAVADSALTVAGEVLEGAGAVAVAHGVLAVEAGINAVVRPALITCSISSTDEKQPAAMA